LEQQRDQYKDLMLQAYGAPGGSGSSTPSQTPTKGAASALSAVTGVFSSGKAKETIAFLTAENTELKKLERLRPQLMELQQRLSAAQKQAEEAEAKRSEDVASMTEHNRDLALALKQAQKSTELANAEREDAIKLASEWSAKASKAERELAQVSAELEELKERLAEVTMGAIDPNIVEGLNEKIAELESM
jgi:chromosome segregation ATPase